MIREIGKQEDPVEYLKLVQERILMNENLASTHIGWFTHKNPYACWICDMFVLAQTLHNSFIDFLGPTPVDAEKE